MMFFTSNLMAQLTTIYEVGHYTHPITYPGSINPNTSFEDDNWSFDFVINSSPSTCIGQMLLLDTNLREKIAVSLGFTNNCTYDVKCVKKIPAMANYTSFEVNFGISVTPSSTPVTYNFYTSSDSINWNLHPFSTNYVSSFTTSSDVYVMVTASRTTGFSGNEGQQYEFSQFQLKADLSTGIELNNISDNLNVYSYDKNLVVKSNDTKDYTVTVYNLSGQVILNKTTRGNNNFKLDVSNGMYLVKINNGTESINQKIVIQ
jgi:hypothetical protein